jgi:small-conductance mechanosensitive channel
LFTNSLTVNTAFESRRLEYDVGIGYGDDIDGVKELMLEALHSVPEILKDPAPDVLVMELAQSTVNIRVRWWINPSRRADDLASRDKVLSTIKKILVENGIDLPFPTQQILFHDQTEETDGDVWRQAAPRLRSRQREGWPSGKGKVPKPHRMGDSLKLLAQERSSRDDNGKVDAQTNEQ